MAFRVKVTAENITYGPTEHEIDKLVAITHAQELISLGYRRTSNAYCMVSRIDRPDWIQVLASKMHLSVADFHNVDGSGVSDHWKDHYVRVYSKDNLTVHPQILRHVPSY